MATVLGFLAVGFMLLLALGLALLVGLGIYLFLRLARAGGSEADEANFFEPHDPPQVDPRVVWGDDGED